jgi:hypothetical protein
MKEFSETSLKVRRAHPIAYMDFSFRSRNSFFGETLAAISMANEAAEGDITYVPDYIKMEPGTKRYYWRQILWYSNGRLCEQRIFS